MGWLCSYTPLEIIYAAGFIPFRIDGHSEPIRKSDMFCSPNYCQFVRSTIDVAVDGGYDFLEGVIFVNSCDAMRRLHDIWKKFIPTKFIHMLDLPMGESSSVSIRYLRHEFQKLKDALEEYTSQTISNEKIEEAINLYIESRSLFHKLNSLRKERLLQIRGSEMMEHSLNFFESDPKSWNENIKNLLETHETEPLNTPNNNLPRVVLSGSPIHNVEFFTFIEDCGLNVIYEDICTGSKFFDLEVKKSDDLLNSLSEAYLNRTPCARMMRVDERAKQIIETAKNFKADGVIVHSLKFCDVYLYDVPILKELLVDSGLSTLFIESDGRLGSLDQLKTRIEAFSEIIKN